ncbi:MAG: fluoride efflux transporter FluC [Acutalibacter sp.]
MGGPGRRGGRRGRYGISLLPWKGRSLLTLAKLPGGCGHRFPQRPVFQRLLGERGKLFWQTGVCGGFTTFSTFSLEAVTLFQNGRYLLGGAYVLLSVALCVAGVLLGQCLARAVAHS